MSKDYGGDDIQNKSNIIFIFPLLLTIDLINIYTILVAFWLYFEGELAFFITQMCVIGLFKIYRLLVMFKNGYYFSTILDFFCVGSLEYLCSYQYFYIIFKDFHSSYLQVIIQFSFFFCKGILKNSNIQSWIVVASYLNFFLIIFEVYMQSYFQEYRNKDKNNPYIFRSFVAMFSYYGVLCCLTFFELSQGFYLIYFELIFILLHLILLIISIKFIQKTDFWKDHFQNFIMNFDYYFGFETLQKDIKFDKMMNLIINYCKQLVKIAILLPFFIIDITQSYQQQWSTLQYRIKFIIVLISLFLSFIYLFQNFKEIFKCLFRQKCISLTSLHDLQKFTQKYNNRSSSIEIFRVVQVSIKEIEISNQEINSSTQLQSDNEEQINLQFWQTVSFLIKKNKNVILEYNQTKNFQIYKSILTEVENVHKDLFFYYEYTIKKTYQIDEIIIKRIENGFVGKKLTMKLLKIHRKRNDISGILNMLRDILMINLYYKEIYDLMIFNPNHIYQDLLIK